MADYPPPIDNVPIFNPENFRDASDPVTHEHIIGNYLQYPLAQGTETLRDVQIIGDVSLTKNPTATISATNDLNIQSGFTRDINISSGNILNLLSDQTFVNNNQFINLGSYNQSIRRNDTNPTDITTSTELIVCSTVGNQLTMRPYTEYFQLSFMFKVVNLTASVITMTSPDINFNSWLRGNVGLVYNIQPNSAITCYLIAPSITLGVAVWYIRDDFGYKTVNTTTNTNHYLNFSDSSSTGVGNIQKCAGIYCNPNLNFIYATAFIGSCTQMITTTDNTNGNYYIPFSKTPAGDVTPFYLDDTTTALTYNPSTSTLTATTFNGSATGVLTTSDNSNTTCYIPFVKGTAQANSALFLDDTTGPLTYNPSLGGLTFSIAVCPRYDSSSNTANCSLFGNTTTGNIIIANALTTGSISIGTNAMTSGNINIGTAGATGLVNIRPVLVLNRQLRTNNVFAPSNALDLGFETTVTGTGFANTVLAANVVTNVYAVSFNAGNYGTYMFIAQTFIGPTNTTAIRTCEMSISTITSQIQEPYVCQNFTAVGGGISTQNLTRVIQIYTPTTITLTARCDTPAIILTAGGEGLFQYIRIA